MGIRNSRRAVQFNSINLKLDTIDKNIDNRLAGTNASIKHTLEKIENLKAELALFPDTRTERRLKSAQKFLIKLQARRKKLSLI